MFGRMRSLRVVLALSLLAACGSRAAAPPPPVEPLASASNASAPVASCAHGLYLVDDNAHEVRTADVASCTTQLDTAVSDAWAARKQAIATLDEQIAAVDTRGAAAIKARDEFLVKEGLRSITLDDQLALRRERIARAKRPLKTDLAEVERLEKLVDQDHELRTAVDAIEDEKSKLMERRSDLMLARPASVLEACTACPAIPAATPDVAGK
jgi:hypothetical protein